MLELRIPNTDEATKKGINTLMIRSVPIKKGSNTVVNLYTLSKEKLLKEATLPVPKKATSIKNRKMSTARPSLALRGRLVVERVPLYSVRSTSSQRSTVLQKQT